MENKRCDLNYRWQKKLGAVLFRINFMACDFWRDVALFMVTPVPQLTIIRPCRCYRRGYAGRSQVCVQRKTSSVHWLGTRASWRSRYEAWRRDWTEDEGVRHKGKTAAVIVCADARPYSLWALSWLSRIIPCARITAKNDISQVNYGVEHCFVSWKNGISFFLFIFFYLFLPVMHCCGLMTYFFTTLMFIFS